MFCVLVLVHSSQTSTVTIPAACLKMLRAITLTSDIHTSSDAPVRWEYLHACTCPSTEHHDNSSLDRSRTSMGLLPSVNAVSALHFLRWMVEACCGCCSKIAAADSQHKTERWRVKIDLVFGCDVLFGVRDQKWFSFITQKGSCKWPKSANQRCKSAKLSKHFRY